MDPEALHNFRLLKKSAKAAGFDLSLMSAFRSFEQQMDIWSKKLQGLRKVHDDEGRKLDVLAMPIEEKVDAIIRFSAVPGLSRHHMATDIDVFDANAMAKDDVRLEPAEVNQGGPCAPMHDWLDVQIESGRSFGFYRPFTSTSQTVAPERWHLSYRANAERRQKEVSADLVASVWESRNVPLCDYLVANKEALYEHFIGAFL